MSRCTLSGWAVDFKNNSVFSEIYLKMGEKVVKGELGSRIDVASSFNNENYKESGFYFDFISSFLFDKNGELIDSLEVILVGKDGTFMYEPVIYQIKEKEIELPNLPVIELQENMIGICLDTFNNSQIKNNNQILSNLIINDKEESCKIMGWAVDSINMDSLSDIYLTIGEKVIKGTYGNERKDVAEYYSNHNYKDSGFSFEFDSSLFYNINGELVDEISFTLVGKDGTFMYEPITYSLEVNK